MLAGISIVWYRDNTIACEIEDRDIAEGSCKDQY